MHRETLSSLIESGSSAVGAFLKEALIHRKEMDRMEAEKEKEIELAKIRNRPTDNDETEAIVEEVTEAPETPPSAEIEAAIDELMENEMCSVCRELLGGLKHRPPREQVIGVAEYGEFKRELDTDADIDALKEQINQTTVLKKVLEENLGAPT